MSVKDWSTETWTALATIVAFIALIQPWLLSLWRRLFKRGSIDIHPTSLIEVGYSGFGATIGLMGTLRAVDRDMFVQWVKLILVRSDDSVREFEWNAFRTPKISVGTAVGQSAEVGLQVPFSLLILALQPHQFNIIFSDPELIRAAQPTIQAMHSAWIERTQKLGLGLQPSQSHPNYQQNLKRWQRAFTEFLTDITVQEALAVLNHLFYWNVGTYHLTMYVQTARPNKVYKETWSFTLTEGDVEKFKSNTYSILEELCGLPLTAGAYGFAYPAYNS
jgi:hypothetical protein